MIAVFLKEIRILLRSRKAFWMLLTTLLLVGGTLCLQWVNGMRGDFALNYRATLGREFFLLVATAQLIVMGFTSALMSATAVTAERESGTLELLMATGLPRARILLGKWLAAIFFQLLVAACLLPVLAPVFQLGGVGGDELLFAGVMTALTVMTFAMIGITASCKKKKTSSALHATISQILLYILVIPLGLGIVAAPIGVGRPAPGTSIFDVGLFNLIFWSTSPLMTWVYHLEAFPRGASGSLLASPILHGHALFQSLVFAFALSRALRALRRQAESEDAPAPGMAPAGDLPADWPVPPRTEPRPLTRLIEDHQNPVALKEFNNWMENRTYALTGSIALCLLLSLILIFAAMAGDYRDSMRALGATITILLMLVLPAFTAPAFSREREERTLDLLRATPFTARQLVAAKSRAALRVTLLFFAALATVPVIVRLLALFGDPEKLQRGSREGMLPNLLGPTLLFALPVFAFAWLFIAIGIYCSSRQRRTLGALLQTYLVLFLLAFLPLPIERILVEGMGASEPAEIAMRIIEAPMPLFNCFHYFLGGGGPKSSLLCLASHNHFAGLVLWMAVHAAAVLLLAYFIMRAAARRLEKEGQS